MPTALITGITGQDGSYLAELLLEKGYEVHGVIRRASRFNTQRIDHLYSDPHEGGKLRLHYGDLLDGVSLRRLLESTQPDEVYHLGAQSHVRVSFDMPGYTVESIVLGTLSLLEAIRDVGPKAIRFYQAGSSEMYGAAPAPQDEDTRFVPRSPYACAKVYAHHQVINYRDAYGMFAVNGILFNHESPRRGETFLTRKVTRAATRIAEGLQQKLYLGNQDARRDWGYAGDYVRAMWLMLQQDEPDDYVVATGEDHSVREWVERSFAAVGLDPEAHIRVDERYLRPTEVDHLRGDASKARRALGWRPEVTFEELIERMIEHDKGLAARERLLRDAGHADAAPAEA
ncbi:MAG: GDP-mannose 4,6-dehydratase [Planctomycetota bacterium]|nr:GDP-mannose 4,6-dehydratase [Planctomycetota bacterium]